MLGGTDKQAANNIIAASETRIYKRVFFLGPFARRVSFSSQQNRALNLVWALQGMERIKRGDRIAVVGGGLSGITAAAALLGRGYLVTLYECGEAVLNRQSSADHRYIHPSVNRWPEMAVEETTVVPYFDWISDFCSDLVETLRGEWKRLKNADGLTFVPDVHISDFSETDEEVGVVTKDACACKEERYSAVLVTSGFADEDYGVNSDLKGYWHPDGLERFVSSKEGRDTNFLVSGCGDGGLIDALRIAHVEFKKGKLIVDVARRLKEYRVKGKPWPWLQKIAEVEEAVANSTAVLSEAIALGSPELEAVYKAAAKNLPAEITELLDASLRRNRGAKFVTLLSRQKGPYSPMSAPIHKLLIAHAMRRQTIVHHSCFVVTSEKDHVMVVPADTKAEDIEVTPKEPITGFVIVRHGAQPNFRIFFKKGQQKIADDLVSRQRLLAADLDEPLWRLGKHRLMTWPPKGDLREALMRRKDLATQLIQRSIKDLSGQRLDLDERKGFYYYYSDELTADRIASLPAQIFGFPLFKERDRPEVQRETRAAGSPESWDSYAEQGPITAGHPIVSALSGRLGPLFKDPTGRLVSLTAGHIAPAFGALERRAPTPAALPVNDHQQVTIGRLETENVPGTMIDRDIALVVLNAAFDADPSYADFPRIIGTVSAIEAFGQQVFLERRGKTCAIGYVSATRAAVWLRHPGGERRIIIYDAIRVRSADPTAPFAEAGDSGAPVVDAEARLLGIILSTDDEYAYVLPIADVIANLGLIFLSEAQVGNRAAADAEPEPGFFAETLDLFADTNRREQDGDDILFLREFKPEKGKRNREPEGSA